MAYARKRGGRWFARWKDAHGRWRELATSAKTKTDCERFAAEIEAKGDRQRAGLEPLLPEDGGGTVAELLDWWIETYRQAAPGLATEKCAIRKHLTSSELGSMRLANVRPPHIERFLQAKTAEGLAPQTVNHLRGHLGSAFAKAKKAGRWEGPNPVREVEPRKVTLPTPEWLTADEVRAILSHTEEPLRSLFAVAAYTGLRWGELAALRKRDVQLDPEPRITVCRSWERDTTKGGRARVVPVAGECAPFLRNAITLSPSEYVFPGPKGRPRSRKSNLSKRLREAMARAGVVEGYTHVCRARVNAKGVQDKTAPRCTYTEDAPDKALRFCPIHGHKLWPRPKVRKSIHFHNLRHTTGSLLAQARVPIAAVAAVLGHSDVRLTIQRYAHLSPDYLRSEVESLRLGVEPPDPVEPVSEPEALQAVASDLPRSNRAHIGQSAEPPKTKTGRPGFNLPEHPAYLLERETGFGPATLSLGS